MVFGSEWMSGLIIPVALIVWIFLFLKLWAVRNQLLNQDSTVQKFFFSLLALLTVSHCIVLIPALINLSSTNWAQYFLGLSWASYLISLGMAGYVMYKMQLKWPEVEEKAYIKEKGMSRRLSRLQAQAAELKIQEHRLSSLLALNANFNSVLIERISIDKILDKCCAVIANYPGYCTSWVGLVRKGNDTILINHFADHSEPAYLAKPIKVSLDPNSPYRKGPAANAVKKKQIIHIEDVANSPFFKPWRDNALKSGINACIGVPIQDPSSEEAMGCLMVYRNDGQVFHEDEQAIFQELCSNLGRALNMVREREARKWAEESLAVSRERLSLALAGARLGFWEWNLLGNQVLVDDRFKELFKFSVGDEQTFADWLDLIEPEYQSEIEKNIQSAILHKLPFRIEFQLQSQTAWFEISGAAVEWLETGDPIRLSGTLKDITQRKELELSIQKSESKFRQLIDSLPTVAVQGYDKNRKVISWNKASEALYGFSSEEAIGQKLEDLILPEEIKQDVLINIKRWIDQGQEIPAGELTLQDKNHQPVEVFSSHVMLGATTESPEMFCIDLDMRAQKKAQAAMERLAAYDQLTALPNRRLIEETANRWVKLARRENRLLGLIFIDIDNFKDINDTLGHPVGDQLLIQVSQRIQHCIRQSDMFGRLSGDEFVLLLPEVEDSNVIAKIADKIVSQFGKPFALRNSPVRVTASMGIAIFPYDCETTEDLFRHADQAMYEVKKRGRNGYTFFTREINETVERRQAILKRLRKAVIQGEFSLLFQPKISLYDGFSQSCEALIRWNDQELGEVSPSEFIEIAEQNGLIDEITRWVLIEICLFKQKLNKEGFKNYRINFNFSGAHSGVEDFLLGMPNVLKEYDLDLNEIGIELTEQTLFGSEQHILDVMHQLTEQGMAFALDDFGTGYSSLAYVKKFPVGTIKIDQSFIRGITQNIDDYKLVELIIGLTHSLGKTTIAEGVESAAQFEVLKKLKCQLIQGHFGSKPLTSDALLQNLMLHQGGFVAVQSQIKQYEMAFNQGAAKD